MFNWDVKDMKLLKTKQNSGIYIGREYIFPEVLSLSREDKIQFIDNQKDGLMSYILFLFNKWDDDYDNLPKDSIGNVRTSALFDWICQNDTRNDVGSSKPIINRGYYLGRIDVLGLERKITLKNNKSSCDTFDDIVDEIFFRILKSCLEQEEKYFRSTDIYEIAKSKILNYMNRYNTSFDINILVDGSNRMYIMKNFNSSQEITLRQCMILIQMYEDLEKKFQQLSANARRIFNSL